MYYNNLNYTSIACYRVFHKRETSPLHVEMTNIKTTLENGHVFMSLVRSPLGSCSRILLPVNVICNQSQFRKGNNEPIRKGRKYA